MAQALQLRIDMQGCPDSVFSAAITMNSATSATLLERLHRGADPLAWDDFFARYWPMIYGFAKHRACSGRLQFKSSAFWRRSPLDPLIGADPARIGSNNCP